MSQKKSQEPASAVAPGKGVELIERQILEGEVLGKKRPLTEGDYSEWRTHTDGVLELVFGASAGYRAQFFNAASAIRTYVSHGEAERERSRHLRVEAQLVKLRAFVKILKDKVDILGATEDQQSEKETMGSHDTAIVCENGHVINSSAQSSPEFSAKFCSSCGAKAVDRCTQCGKTIKGEYHTPGVAVIGLIWSPPSHCHECGTQFPWTAKKAKALADAIEELDDLKPEERKKLQESVPDIIAKTANTDTAVIRFKKGIAKLGAGVAGVFKDVLVSVATEAAKKGMGL